MHAIISNTNGILNSDKTSFEFLLSADEEEHKGPWYEANRFLLDSEIGINKLLAAVKASFPVRQVDFSNTETSNINEDMEFLFKQLDRVEEQDKNVASAISQNCKLYFKNTMIPKLFKLEIILPLHAYNLKGKPIIDLFYKFEKYNGEYRRVMKDYKEFSSSIGGHFMASFYKVCIA